ncbi:MAG TPA: hypothetical protein VI911_07670 [Patescibacteria group bacterium]|nr:hypothetical protein [Patescibacteria group bacterium]
MVDTTTVEGYKQYCEEFHVKRLSTASLIGNKMKLSLASISDVNNPGTLSLTEYELVIAIEAMNFYLKYTK